MRIGINALTLSDNNSGIGNYTLNLINRLAENLEDNLVVYASCKERIRSLIDERVEIVDFPSAGKNKYARIMVEQLLLPGHIRRDKLDLLFSPAFTMPLFSSARNVVTVHDLAYKIYPEGSALLSRIYMRLIFDGSIRKADHILTVSDATKRDLLRFFPDIKGATTTHLGTIEYGLKEKERPRFLEEGEPFLLVVGTITPRKNVLGIIQAFQSVRDQVDARLVFSGGFAYQSDEVHDYIREQGLGDRVVLAGYLSDEELAYCYSQARMLLYCSFYEGFGLPPLEAMQADTPVIASNVSSIPEVVGDAALLIDPHKTGQIAEAIVRLDGDDELRRTLVEKGRERCKSFRWEDTASQTRDVFRETVERV